MNLQKPVTYATGVIESLVTQIKSLPQPKDRPYIIAISGFGGSGKTTLATSLKAVLKDADVVCIDSFSNHEWRRSEDWDNFDRERFTKEVLVPARRNQFPLTYARIPWPDHVADPAIVVPRVRYLIVEGCSIFHPDLLGLYDSKIWVDCPLEEATKRAMWRDRYVHKDEHDDLWLNVWMPNEVYFLEKYHPDKMADIVVSTQS